MPIQDNNDLLWKKETTAWPTLVTVNYLGVTYNFAISAGDSVTYRHWKVGDLSGIPIPYPDWPTYADPAYPGVTIDSVNREGAVIALQVVTYQDAITSPIDEAVFWEALTLAEWSDDYKGTPVFGFLDGDLGLTGSGLLTTSGGLSLGGYQTQRNRAGFAVTFSLSLSQVVSYRFVFTTTPTCRLTITWDEVLAVTRDGVTTETATVKTWTWVPPGGTCLQILDGAPVLDAVYYSPSFDGPVWTSGDYDTVCFIRNVAVDYSS